jgi:hypothetical protein
MTSPRIPLIQGTVSTGSEASVSDTYVAGPPSSAPITISRQALVLLALVDIWLSARRVLDVLLYMQDPKTGAADVCQADVCAVLGTGKPGVSPVRGCGCERQPCARAVGLCQRPGSRCAGPTPALAPRPPRLPPRQASRALQAHVHPAGHGHPPSGTGSRPAPDMSPRVGLCGADRRRGR